MVILWKRIKNGKGGGGGVDVSRPWYSYPPTPVFLPHFKKGDMFVWPLLIKPWNFKHHPSPSVSIKFNLILDKMKVEAQITMITFVSVIYFSIKCYFYGEKNCVSNCEHWKDEKTKTKKNRTIKWILWYMYIAYAL